VHSQDVKKGVECAAAGEGEHEDEGPDGQRRLEPPLLFHHQELGDARHEEGEGDRGDGELVSVEGPGLLEVVEPGRAVVPTEEAEKEARMLAEAQAEKKALIDALSKPSGISEEEAIRRAMAIIERGIKNLKTESEVFRFPNQLCTDKGRAINQQELGWEKTLTGEPKEMYEFWQKHLRPRGYKLKVQIMDFPDGLPGDIGMTLTWH
jgi:hypothetical protein